jgi:membrane protein implicated in regulation of membrane protease activity
MDSETLTWLFLIGGTLLMISELMLPGGVAFFLGISALGVGVMRLAGLLSDPVSATAAWLLISVGLTIAIRPFIKKYFKSETTFKIADEDYEAMDKIALVTEDLSDKDNSGRIRFGGATWQARSMDGRVEAGKEVIIRYRENTTWVVEPVQGSDPQAQTLKQPERN